MVMFGPVSFASASLMVVNCPVPSLATVKPSGMVSTWDGVRAGGAVPDEVPSARKSHGPKYNASARRVTEATPVRTQRRRRRGGRGTANDDWLPCQLVVRRRWGKEPEGLATYGARASATSPAVWK